MTTEQAATGGGAVVRREVVRPWILRPYFLRSELARLGRFGAALPLELLELPLEKLLELPLEALLPDHPP